MRKVSKETALILKQKGFIQKIGSCIIEKNGSLANITQEDPLKNKNAYQLPRMSEVQEWLWKNYKIWVSVTLDTIDDSETSFTWNISQYIQEGFTRKKDTWDYWKHTNSLSEKYMYWDENPNVCLEKGIQEALKLIS